MLNYQSYNRVDSIALMTTLGRFAKCFHATEADQNALIDRPLSALLYDPDAFFELSIELAILFEMRHLVLEDVQTIAVAKPSTA